MPSRHRTARRLVRSGLALAGLLAASTLGCAFGEIRPSDPFDRELSLDRAQHRYTTLVRFSEFEKARKFVLAEEQDAFMDRMRALKDARFTDFESGDPEPSDDKRSATVRVTYTIYTPSMPYEIEVSEIQEWSRTGLGNNWRVSSRFEGLAQLAAH